MNIRSAMLGLGSLLFHIVLLLPCYKCIFTEFVWGFFCKPFSAIYVQFSPKSGFFSTAYKYYFIVDLFMATAKPSHLWEIHF